MRKLLVVFAVALGLEDEEYLVNKHRYAEKSGDHLRYMKYYARSEEENRKLGGVWLKGYSLLSQSRCKKIHLADMVAGIRIWAV